jgi:hypothetical protein
LEVLKTTTTTNTNIYHPNMAIEGEGERETVAKRRLRHSAKYDIHTVL